MWEKRYLLGGLWGYENLETHDIIFVMNRIQWEVIVNTKTIKQFSNEEQAIDFMNEYIMR